MFKLIVVTLAAFVAILQIFGDPARRPSVERSTGDGLTLASFIGLAEPVEEARIDVEPRISEAEAIKRALKAGAVARNERAAAPRVFAAAARQLDTVDAVEEPKPVKAWFVTGSRVNVRQGPGTGNAVVGQVTQGMEAQVLETRDGWMQIVTKDGGASGWISGRFLEERQPG